MEAPPPTAKAIDVLRRQVPLELDGIMHGKEQQQQCPLWRAYRGETIIGHGEESVAIVVSHRKSGRRFVAKFTPVTQADQLRPRVRATAEDASPKLGQEFRPDSLYAVKQIDPWQVPAVRSAHAFSELHNWIVAQHALRPNADSSRLQNASNVARLHDWTLCEWLVHDSILLFRDPLPEERTEEFLRLPETDSSVVLAVLLQERQDKRQRQKVEQQFSRGRMMKQRIDVQILLVDYVKGETLSVSIKQRTPVPYPYQRSKQFFDAWTQIACTKSFLEKRVHFDHGDLHPKNVMSESTDQAFPQVGPRKPVLLVYDLPLTDQLGRTFDWRFCVYEPERIVRIIDFGRARSKLEFEEDLRSAPKGLGVADKLTWTSDYPDFYALHGDLFAFATGVFLEMARILQYATDFDSKADEIYDIGRVAFHALERRPYDNAPRLLAEELKSWWQRDQLLNPDRKAVATFGEKLYQVVLEQTQITYACLSQKQRGGDCALPPPALPAEQQQAGRWTVDEHLTFFAPQLGGFSKSSGYQSAAAPRPEWFERYIANPGAFYVVEMLPRERPRAFPRETLDPKRTVSYPVFRGRETGDPELDDHLRRYVLELGAANPQ